jgi:hypothetical protein
LIRKVFFDALIFNYLTAQYLYRLFYPLFSSSQ